MKKETTGVGNPFLEGVVIGLMCAVITGIVAWLMFWTVIKTRYPNAHFELSQTAVTSSDTFTLKGVTSAQAEIDGETHNIVCYHATVSDFWLSQCPEEKELIGEDEKFTKVLLPDGTTVYHSTYYERLDDNLGLKVTKEFLDHNTEDIMYAGAETPLYIEFYPSTGYFSGILEDYDKGLVPTVQIN